MIATTKNSSNHWILEKVFFIFITNECSVICLSLVKFFIRFQKEFICLHRIRFVINSFFLNLIFYNLNKPLKLQKIEFFFLVFFYLFIFLANQKKVITLILNSNKN
jgi:hypothetical protein